MCPDIKGTLGACHFPTKYRIQNDREFRKSRIYFIGLPQSACRFRAHPHPIARTATTSPPVTRTLPLSSSIPVASSTVPRPNRWRLVRRCRKTVGCWSQGMGKGDDAKRIQALHPNILGISGPAAYEEVVGAVHEAIPINIGQIHWSTWCGTGHQTHATSLCLSENFRGLQSPLPFLHHSQYARGPSQQAHRRHHARG